MITVNSDALKNDVPLSEKDRAIVEAISMYVNGSCMPLKAGKELANIHRALHTGVLKLFVGWCRQMAIDHYKGRYDERNRVVSRKVAELYESMIKQKFVDDKDFIAETLF